MSDVRPDVVDAGAEVISAATAYVEGRQNVLSTIAMVPLYRRLETAVIAFQKATGDDA